MADQAKPEDTRTPFQQWLGGIAQSMEAQRLTERQRVNMATGGDGGPGTSPVSRLFGFFTDTPREAQERGARVAQFQGADWQAIRDRNEAALAAQQAAQFAPVAPVAGLPQLSSELAAPAASVAQADRAAPAAGRPVLSFGAAQGALPRLETSQQLRLPDIVEYTPEQRRVQAMGAALAGIPPQALQQMMAAMPARPGTPSAKERAGATLLDLSLSDFMEQMGSATSREEQAAARDALFQRLTILGGGNALLAPSFDGGGN